MQRADPMNVLRSVLLALVSFTGLAPAAITADRAPLRRELEELKKDQEKAVAAALNPVNRRYQASLEALLRQAMEANDLHTANLVNAELKKLGVAVGNVPAFKSPVTAENFEKRLIGTQWIYFGKETITFLEGGKAQWKDSPVLWSWSVKNAGSRVIEGENPNKNTKWKITFDRELQTGRLEGDGKRVIQRVK